MTTDENFKHLEQKLERYGAGVSLSSSEKEFHRGEVLSFMRASRKPVPSPYVHLFVLGTRSFAAIILVLVVGGAGLASAAEGSLPGNLLYPVKVRFTEPTVAALSFSKESRADYEVERASRRLEEFARVSTTRPPDTETAEALADSLGAHIEDAQTAITALAAEGNTEEALDASAELEAVLTAHAEVLERFEDVDPDAAEDIAIVSEEIESGIAETSELSESLEDTVTETIAEDIMETLHEQKEDAENTAARLLERIQLAHTTLGEEDEQTALEEMAVIEELLAQAAAAETEGLYTDALLLYIDADEKLTHLEVFLETDTELGIDVIEGEE